MITLDNEQVLVKEIIRKNIRNALHEPNINKYHTNIIHDPANSENPINDFIINFRNKGGKFIPCTKDNFQKKIIQVIDSFNINSIFAVNQSLISFLQSHKKNVNNVLIGNEPADLAIFFPTCIVASTGSICFTNHNVLYPSVYNISKKIIVLARLNTVVNDNKEAIAFCENIYFDNECNNSSVIEFVSPTIVKNENQIEEYFPENPLFVLFLIV